MFNHMFVKALGEAIKNATTAEIPDMDISTMDLSGLSEEDVELINSLEFIHNKICKPLIERGVRLRMLNEELDIIKNECNALNNVLDNALKEHIKKTGGII